MAKRAHSAPLRPAGEAAEGSPARQDDAIRNCSVERTLDIVSDVWSFLVLRECYLGVRRFDQIQSVLGLPRSTLSERLGLLVDQGILRRERYSEAPPRDEYRLTEMGLDLYLVMLTLLRFGDDWLSGGRSEPLTLVHSTCGQPCRAESCCSHCGGAIAAHEVSYRDGPGAGHAQAGVRRRRRRAADLGQLERGRPSSASRALRIIGDRWSFLVLRECFFGVTRFDAFRARLGVASNILADRLARLVEAGVLRRRRYQDSPERFEYRLSAMGMALYLPMIEMLRFGDRWLSEAPPLLLTHRTCGHDFLPVVCCDHCGEALTARDLRFQLNYPAPLAARPRAQLA
ncbi:MAG: helix-turn-helix domain-containing protein [Phenylobacterium sp.]